MRGLFKNKCAPRPRICQTKMSIKGGECVQESGATTALVLGGTILAGLASLAYSTNKQQAQSSSAQSVNISQPTSLGASRQFLLSLCAQYPTQLQQLARMLNDVQMPPFSKQQAVVLDEFKKFILMRIFFISSPANSFVFQGEQMLYNDWSNTALLAYIALCAYEMRYKNFV